MTFRKQTLLAALLTGLALSPLTGSAIDLNGDGVSDIWQMIYGSSYRPSQDTDGTGMTNLQKSLAGLDPSNPASVLRVSSVSVSGSNLAVTWPSVANKLYQLQSSPTLGGGSWVNTGTPVVGTGAPLTSAVATTGTNMFFRVAVADIYSNGTGLSDWEAVQLGLNPANPNSNGRLDGNGQPISDYNYVVTALSSSNSVSIFATKPGATIPLANPASDRATLTLSRTGNLNAITVNLAVSGLAIPGVDYAAIPTSIKFPVGVNTASISVSPLATSGLLAGAPVTVTVMPDPSYQVGSPASDSAVIYPSSNPTGTGLTGQYFASSSPTYTGTANFNAGTLKVARTDPQVNFYWGQGQPYPAVNRNNFSAAWKGLLLAPTTGGYAFGVQADAGARVYVNNQLVIDAWAAGSSTAAPLFTSTSIALTAGQTYPVEVDYYENTDPASIYLTWQPPAGAFAAIPSGNVFQPTHSGSTGWEVSYYNNVALSGSAAYSTIEKAVTWNWGTGSPDPSIPTTKYSARWTGQVQPQYSEPYTFVTHTDDGTMLKVNGQLITSNWKDQTGSDVASTTINLQAGARYDLQMDYFQDGPSSAQAYLSWYSPSQPQQIIPQNCLYPSAVSSAPSVITSATTAVVLIGGSFNYSVAASNTPTGFSVSGLPPGVTYNATSNTISGTVAQAGRYNIIVTSSNSHGMGSAAITLNAINTGVAVTRQVWTGVPGTLIASIPVKTPPIVTGTLASLEGLSNYGTNYGERIYGYLTAPVTGNYYFWIAGSDTAELWISNDGEPVNRVKRASVGPGTASRVWNSEAGQQSAWLALTAGQKYYIEVLHKAGGGGGDNVAVGWLRPDQVGSGPSEVVPGYALSAYTPPVSSAVPGTLYSATLLAQQGVATKGVGTATMIVSPDQSQVTIAYSSANLTSGITDTQVQSDPYLTNGSQVLFDITKFVKQNPDGSYTFKIVPVGSLGAADVLEIINEGKAYLTIGTTNNAGGEIRGNFTLANGSQTFTPPPAPPTLSDDHGTDAGASRFLAQATFGPTPTDIASVKSLGYDGWITNQFAIPATHHLNYVLANPNPYQSPAYPDTLTFNSWWQQSVSAPDQLRQRVAFALSEIMVVSDVGALNNNALTLSSYYDTLLDNAFGSYHDLLKAVTLTSAMGNYLNMRGNDKANYAAGLHPNENYAREINQLFSIGLYRMWPDGTLVENSAGSLVPTYTQSTVQGFAAAFTGWNYHQANQGNGRLPSNWYPGADYTNPMVAVPAHHDRGAKLLLDNVVLPPATVIQADPTNVAYDAYATGDMDASLNAIVANQNVGPLICRELIQRLVTSNPSRDYLYRIAQVFNDDGTGARGNLQAVIRAILEDYEARSPDAASQPTFGKQREPLIRVTAPSRYFASTLSLSGSYSQAGAPQILITTGSANRLSNNDTVFLNFTSGSPQPFSGAYRVSNVTPNSFAVTAAGLTTGTYGQVGSTITLNINPGLPVGGFLYLAFTSGGAASGVYAITSLPDASHMTVTAPDSVNRSGNVALEKFNGSFVVATSGSSQPVITLTTSVNHALNAGDPVDIQFTSGTAVSGTYSVVSVADQTHFTVAGTVGVGAQSNNSLSIFPLVPPPLTRSGAVTAATSTWNMGQTDNSVTQTPLNAPTVFNYFYPGYRFPGAIESAGLTTPEFQLTNATSVMVLTNYLQAGILASGNTTGLTSFNSGNGAIVMDLAPYLSMTSDSGIPGLVTLLNNQLMGGSMSSALQSDIVGYVANTANFPYSSPPTTVQQRDRARAVVHLLLTSPEFAIQR